nr:LuxR C-terminal-related transcriptional regulator [Pseudomonas costantinii]
MLLSGFLTKIARKLSLSTETIKVHRHNIYSELNIKTRSELFARFYAKTGCSRSELNSTAQAIVLTTPLTAT